MERHATWIDPQNGREGSASVTDIKVEGAWLILTCLPNYPSTTPGHIYIPATTTVYVQ